jgi:hypothetical protein
MGKQIFEYDNCFKYIYACGNCKCIGMIGDRTLYMELPYLMKILLHKMMNGFSRKTYKVWNMIYLLVNGCVHSQKVCNCL